MYNCVTIRSSAVAVIADQQYDRLRNSLRPVHTGNFVAIFGNKLLPKTATIRCHFRQQIVSRNGNNLLPICCSFPQQFVAVFGNNLLPVWTGL